MTKMEHIYTIKVKRQFDPRGLYPSERRYSASTVFGLAWLHLAIAATCFLLACLALYNPARQDAHPLLQDIRPSLEEARSQLPKLPSTTEAPTPPPTRKPVFFRDFMPNGEEVDVTRYGDVSEVDHDSDKRNGKSSTANPDNANDDMQYPDVLLSENFSGYPVPLVLAPSLVAVGALAAGLAAVLASRRWYVDHNITWFFLSSVLSTMLSFAALCMIIYWIASNSDNGLSFCDYFSDGNLFGKVRMVPESTSNASDQNAGNRAWYYVIKVPIKELQEQKIPLLGEEPRQSRTRKVLSINILIAASVQIVWSLLSLKIAWRGMRADYPEDDALDNRRGSPTVHVVTEIKGNNTKHLPKNTKILPPQPDLIEHYPKSNKIKKFFQSQQENGGFFLRTHDNDSGLLVVGGKNAQVADFPTRESTAEYRERMLNFLNRCAVSEGLEPPESQCGAPDSHCPSEPEPADPAVEAAADGDRISSLSWGDVHDHTIYDQNTLDLEKIVLNIDISKVKCASPDVAKEHAEVSEDAADATDVEVADSNKEQDSKC